MKAFLPLLLLLTTLSCSQPAPQLASQDMAAAPASEEAAPDAFNFVEKHSVHHGPHGRLLVPADDTLSAVPPVRANSVEEQQARFLLPPGYSIEPVLTEPEILEPAAIAFDGNGRMFVLELRTYMQDIDAGGELEPMSRISMHEDLDDDGVYETHHVFVDSLIFPRFVTPFGINSILSMESNEDEVYQFTDTDGDGRADKKTLFTTNYGKSGNVEHQQSFMYWGMDNWMYSTYNTFRVRWTPNGILRESTGSNRSQWGVTQDNEGKIWFQGGASGVPGYFQFPVVYGNFDVEEPFAEGFEVPYGVAGVGDYQPGPQFARADGTLNRVTGSAGNDIVRGHRMPADLQGHYLYGEPVARVVRRVAPVNTEGLTQLHNVYQEERSEFIRSTDPLFRPVDIASAPDGSLYIVDMYRGIIQQGNWVQEGSFLRAKVEQYQFDKIFGHGRIWRVKYDGLARDKTRPRMFEETPAQWVQHLAHPNGWWRDAAQQLLVLQQDKSVAPALEDMARTSDNPYARYHALWTLEGLWALDADLVRTLFEDDAPGVRVQAIRASETLYKLGDTSFAADYKTLAQDPDPDVAVQALLTMKALDPPGKADAIQAAMVANPAVGVQFVGDKILHPPERRNFGGNQLSKAERALLTQGEEIFNGLCAQCHGNTGAGTPLGEGRFMAPALMNNPRVQGHQDYVVKTLLHGLTGPINGKSYPGDLMVGMAENDDAWIASVASFVRTSLMNEATLVTPEAVAQVRARTAERRRPYTFEELTVSVPTLLRFDREAWQVTSSHTASNRVGGTDSPIGALSYESWSTGAPQAAGMWFQIELPAPVALAQIQFMPQVQYRGRGPDALPPLWLHPRTYQVRVSMDGDSWRTLKTVAGRAGHNVVDLAPTPARFIRLDLTGPAEEDAAWSMREMKLFGIE